MEIKLNIRRPNLKNGKDTHRLEGRILKVCVFLSKRYGKELIPHLFIGSKNIKNYVIFK